MVYDANWKHSTLKFSSQKPTCLNLWWQFQFHSLTSFLNWKLKSDDFWHWEMDRKKKTISMVELNEIANYQIGHDTKNWGLIGLSFPRSTPVTEAQCMKFQRKISGISGPGLIIWNDLPKKSSIISYAINPLLHSQESWLRILFFDTRCVEFSFKYSL